MKVLEQLKKDLVAERSQADRNKEALIARKNLRKQLALDCKNNKQAVKVLMRHNLPNGWAHRMWEESIRAVNLNEDILKNLAEYNKVGEKAVEVRSYILETMQNFENL